MNIREQQEDNFLYLADNRRIWPCFQAFKLCSSISLSFSLSKIQLTHGLQQVPKIIYCSGTTSFLTILKTKTFHAKLFKTKLKITQGRISSSNLNFFQLFFFSFQQRKKKLEETKKSAIKFLSKDVFLSLR